MIPRRRSLRDRFHGWPYYADGLVVADRAIEEVAEWLRDQAKDLEARYAPFPAPIYTEIVLHLRYLADLAEEP